MQPVEPLLSTLLCLKLEALQQGVPRNLAGVLQSRDIIRMSREGSECGTDNACSTVGFSLPRSISKSMAKFGSDDPAIGMDWTAGVCMALAVGLLSPNELEELLEEGLNDDESSEVDGEIDIGTSSTRAEGAMNPARSSGKWFAEARERPSTHSVHMLASSPFFPVSRMHCWKSPR